MSKTKTDGGTRAVAERTKDLLSLPGVDIVAGIKDDAVNRYAAKHRELFPKLYQGTGQTEQLDIKYNYDIQKSPVFNFLTGQLNAAIVNNAQSLQMMSGIDPATLRKTLTASVVSVTLPGTVVKFSALQSGEPLADLSITAKLDCAIRVDPKPPHGKYYLTVLSVNITIDQEKYAPKPKKMTIDCDIKKLIEHILNHLLKDALQNFFNTYPMPQPQELIEFFNTSLVTVQTIDHDLIVGLRVLGTKTGSDSARAAAGGFPDDGTLTHLTLDGIATTGPKAETANRQTASSDFNKAKPVLPKDFELATTTITKADAKVVPTGDAFVAFSAKPFQIVADQKLNIDQHKEDHSGDFWYGWHYRYGWKVWNPKASLIPYGIRVTAQAEADAEGDAHATILSASIGADGKADPSVIADLQFYTVGGTQLWVHPFAFPFAVRVHAFMNPGLPYITDLVLSTILSALLTLFSGIILPLISLFLTFKILTLPNQLPGTPVPVKPSFQNVGNWENLLYVSFNFKFG